MTTKPNDALNPKHDGPWKKPAGKARVEVGERGLWATKQEKQQHQQQVAEKRLAMGYEASAPRCDICAFFQPPRQGMVNSLPVSYPPRCRRHGFRVSAAGCCDTWKGKDGAVLDTPGVAR